MSQRRRMLFSAFHMFSLTHHDQGMWAHPSSRQLEYNSLDYWVDTAKLLERGNFDFMFFADVLAPYESYKGNREASVRAGMQFPINDPGELLPVLAYATENLGFVMTQNVLQEHPYAFARKMSTLDHLSKGRVGWNIVTSFLAGAGRNLGFGGLPEHQDRYGRAEDFLEVVYKLWEASWEDDAVVKDFARKIYTDPAKVHEINHVGRYYDVVGPHLCEPSPQRTPFLFEAASSQVGRDFAGRNAEALFVKSGSPEDAAVVVADLRGAAERAGRSRDDVRLFAGQAFVVGSTEAEARRLDKDLLESQSIDGNLAKQSVFLAYDFGAFDPEEPVKNIVARGEARGMMRTLANLSPNPDYTVGELVRWFGNQRTVGTPEQIADSIEAWQQAGVDGLNITYVISPGSFEDFVEHVVPILKKRGLMQERYEPGTLREKIFGRGPNLPDNHPARKIRRAKFGDAS